MKIQELAIIFIIILLPISIVLSIYTQFQINTLNTQTVYDTKLTAATYDAIKAFQINTANSTLSELSNSKIRDIEASVETFKNSIMSTFELNGYTQEEIEQYIPALVYTMYDGFYIYSPYENTNYLYEYERDGDGNIVYEEGNPKYKLEEGKKIPLNNNDETMYGLKPYITYSCRYKRGTDDFVITYTLDNYIQIQGTISGIYVDDEGYLVDGITQTSGDIYYNGIKITAETQLKENVGNIKRNGSYVEFPYIKLNGTKYYYDNNNTPENPQDDQIFYIANGQIKTQGDYKGPKAVQFYESVIQENTSGIKYYTKAFEFTKRAKEQYKLDELTYANAYDENEQLWTGDTRKIFEFNTDSSKPENNIESELSSYSQHRLAVIRYQIESNLSSAIANYNNYSGATTNEFQMPELKEEEWELILNNISLISFVQGLDIGGKVYNGYTIVNNSESKEAVLEENIYILGKDNNYHRIGDNYLTEDTGNNIQTSIPAGRLNLDFKRKSININTTTNLQNVYYYPLRNYNGSYNSIVTQNNVTPYNDIYAYVNGQNDQLKQIYFTALGRERESAYKLSNEFEFDYNNVLIIGFALDGNNGYEVTTQNIKNGLNKYGYINAKYKFYKSSEATEASEYIRSQKDKYQLIIIDGFAWGIPLTGALLDEISKSTNLITICNDESSVPFINGHIKNNYTAKFSATEEGEKNIGIAIGSASDHQAIIGFNSNVKVLYTADYYNMNTNNFVKKGDVVGYSEGTYGNRWIHSQYSFNSWGNDLKILEKLVYFALNGL